MRALMRRWTDRPRDETARALRELAHRMRADLGCDVVVSQPARARRGMIRWYLNGRYVLLGRSWRQARATALAMVDAHARMVAGFRALAQLQAARS